MKALIAISVSALFLSSCQSLFESRECKVAREGLAEAKVKSKTVEIEHNKRARELKEHQSIPNDLDNIIERLTKADNAVKSASNQIEAAQEELLAESVVKEMCGDKDTD